jgi:hypothetical protein
MNIVRIFLIDRTDDADSYEEWTWKLVENYQFEDTSEEIRIKQVVARDGYHDGNRGFTKNFSWTFDLDHDFVKNDYENALYLRIYKHLLKLKKREESLNSLL